MKKLQLEIYNTLVGRQSIQAFEEFLYSCESILNNVEKNVFFYTILTINYRAENCLQVLEKEACLKYGEDFMNVLFIEKSCIQILQVTNPESYYLILDKMMLEFDIYSTAGCSLAWEFYDYYIQLGNMYMDAKIKERLYLDIQNRAKEILAKLEACDSLRAKKTIVFPKPETNSVKEEVIATTMEKTIAPQKTSLRKKIAQLFTLFAKVH